MHEQNDLFDLEGDMIKPEKPTWINFDPREISQEIIDKYIPPKNTSTLPKDISNIDFIRAITLKEWVREKNKRKQIPGTKTPGFVGINGTLDWISKLTEEEREKMIKAQAFLDDLSKNKK